MTKIDIFSGFLGAGKTTLIKKLLQEVYAGQKIVLIENEFGEIGIDGGFLQEAGIQLTEMKSGCICCSLVGDFGEALKKVMAEYHPDRILIEPSGVGKLSDVAQAVEPVSYTHLISVTPMAMVAESCETEDYVPFAVAMDQAAAACGVNLIGGFSALVHKGMTVGDRRLILSIPEALAATERVCSSVNVATTRAGINMDAVTLMGKIIKETAERSPEGEGRACMKLVVFANAVEDNPCLLYTSRCV